MYSGRQLREIVHFCFLERSLRIADAKLFVLKEGLNLRFFFRRPRYFRRHGPGCTGWERRYAEEERLQGSQGRSVPPHAAHVWDCGCRGERPQQGHPYVDSVLSVQLVTSASERLPSKVEFSRRGPAQDMPAEVATTAPEPVDSEIARQYKRLNFAAARYGFSARKPPLHTADGTCSTSGRRLYLRARLLRAILGRVV
jgi:hypothetical protein